MGWTAPKTWAVGDVLTASDLNTYVRDNEIALQPQAATVATSQTTSSTTYADLSTVGPAVTLVTGTQVLVTVGCGTVNNSVGAVDFMSYAVSGASTIAANDAVAITVNGNGVANVGIQACYQYICSGLTAGTNTFTAKYRVTGGTGTFTNRAIVVEACF